LIRKPGRNEPCWCGSGRKYKQCHLNREYETPLPPLAVLSELGRRMKHRACLHPEASPATCGKVISAHTLQRSRVLANLVDSTNHVFSFYPYWIDADGMRVPHRIGKRQASTFAGFCDRHDAQAFAPLEAVPFSGTREQVFLLGYRAMCWEVFQKMQARGLYSYVRDVIDRSVPEDRQRQLQGDVALHEAYSYEGLQSLQRTKADMDRSFLARDYGSYETYEVVLEGPLKVAAAGAICPYSSPSGVLCQNLIGNTRVQYLSFGVDVSDRGVSVVFLWRAGDGATVKYMDEVQALCDVELPRFLVQFFFAHCENTHFSTTWWESLPPSEREFLTALMANTNPYGYPPEYDLTRCLGAGTLLARQGATR
jgi:hypothetical protein